MDFIELYQCALCFMFEFLINVLISFQQIVLFVHLFFCLACTQHTMLLILDLGEYLSMLRIARHIAGA